MALSIGQRLTLLKIDEYLALTHRYELEVWAATEFDLRAEVERPGAETLRREFNSECPTGAHRT
jgi:hypothetical protein